jgi:hypothetical protein
VRLSALCGAPRAAGAGNSLARVTDRAALEQYDRQLAERLLRALVTTLESELGEVPVRAQALADTVTWYVTHERNRLWLNLSFADTTLGVGGNWTSDEDGLSLYIRQAAYALVDREEEFEP